jgi:hypothetical protein
LGNFVLVESLACQVEFPRELPGGVNDDYLGLFIQLAESLVHEMDIGLKTE